jgi:hypothetical protein
VHIFSSFGRRRGAAKCLSRAEGEEEEKEEDILHEMNLSQYYDENRA